MSILHEISRFVKPQNLMAMFLIFIVVALLNIAALYASPERSIQGKQLETMKRESLEGEILEGRSILVNLPGRVEVLVV